MSFIVFGPGVSDHLTLNQALSPSAMPDSPQPVLPVDAVRPIRGTDEDDTGREAWRDQLSEEPSKESEAHTSAINAYESVQYTQHELRPVQFAEQIMTSPVFSLKPDSRVSELRDLFTRRKIGLVPLIDAQKNLVGIVTKGDLSRQQARDTDLASKPVSTIANPHVLTATMNTNIRELARVLLAQDVRGLPIVDDNGEVVGIVTRGDILRALVNYAPLELWL